MRDFLIKLLGGYKVVILEKDNTAISQYILNITPFSGRAIYYGKGWIVCLEKGKIIVEWRSVDSFKKP